MIGEEFGVVLLSAGAGKRMNQEVPKQYLLIDGKPVLYYSLQAFEKNNRVKEIVIVTSENDRDMVRKEIVEAYGFRKVKVIVAGGVERYHSVYNGIQALEEVEYVMIHDGARPLVNQEMIIRLQECVVGGNACVPAVPCKDTIRTVNEEGFAVDTPDRAKLWSIQTPQTFNFDEFKIAFEGCMRREQAGETLTITDDARVWEMQYSTPVKIVEGVKKIIENDYVLITLIVDDKTPLAEPIKIDEFGKTRTLKTVGDKWSYLQRYKFGANAQPYYVLLDPNGNPLAPSYSFNENVFDYIDFLNLGLRNFKKLDK